MCTENGASNKYEMLFQHLVPATKGLARYAFRKNFCSVLKARIDFFRRKEVSLPIPTPDGFDIGSLQGLISYWDLFVEGSLYDKEWLQRIKVGEPLVLDVGANCGIFSELIFCLNANAKVIAFEPQPDELLKQLTTRHPGRFTIQNKALSNKQETFVLHIAKFPSTTASRYKEVIGESDRSITVNAERLDDLYPGLSPDLIKIDVDGGEFDALQGMADTLKRTQVVLVEVFDDKFAAVDGLFKGWSRKQLTSIDYMYVNPSAR